MKMILIASLLLVAFNASATNNNPPNECGNHGNNCQPGESGGNSSSDSSSSAGAVGFGFGLGTGGSVGDTTSTATGGDGGGGGNGYGGNAVGLGGSGGDSSSAVKDSGNSHNLNANNAQGGDAKAYGGNQSQGQHQSSTSGAVSGSKSIAQMDSENSLKNTVNASSQNANNSQASGNTTVTNVGGDSTVVERNAPPVFLGAITPTSCGGSFNAGGSSRDGAGGFGFSWVGTECAIRLLGDRYQQLGQVDIACELYSSTKAFKKAAKRNPKLASIDCKAKPATAPAPVLVAPELAPRIPRG